MSPVSTRLNYLAASERKPRYYLSQAEDGEPARPATESIAVEVADARAEAALSLEREGIELLRHRSKVTDFYNATEVRRIYFAEVEALVREHLGAYRVHVFDYNVRNSSRAGEKGVSSPVKFVHNDYTETSGPQRVRALLGEKAPPLLEGRFAVVNVWRPIRGPIEENPLGVCDAQSMAPSDFVSTDLVYPDRTGEVYSVKFSHNHRWLYFPRMRAEEVMLLKCYDSAVDGRARFTAHSAFRDPTSPPNPAPRESIEIRTLAFY